MLGQFAADSHRHAPPCPASCWNYQRPKISHTCLHEFLLSDCFEDGARTMHWTDKAAERLICKNVPIDNLHCKSGRWLRYWLYRVHWFICLIWSQVGPLTAAGCWHPMFRERLILYCCYLGWNRSQQIKTADLGSDIVSKLVKVTIGNMFVITSGGGKAVKERTSGNQIKSMYNSQHFQPPQSICSWNPNYSRNR